MRILVGKTSVTCHVDVYRRDIEASDEEHVFHTDITFVRVDEGGNKLVLLPIGTAYAVWTGIGAVSTAVLGMILFHGPATVARICCILLAVSGIVGLAILEK